MLNINYFFRAILAAFTMALPGLPVPHAGMGRPCGRGDYRRTDDTGAGLLFINAMRDVIFGDTNSGLNRMVQVVLIAIAIALGTASA